jgi:large subunit ribosomal protein L6
VIDMSRVGKSPIKIPAGVDVTLAADKVTVKGPLGSLSQALTGLVSVAREGDALQCTATADSLAARAMWGTTRALLANMVNGVSRGFEKKLNLVGVGYRAQAQGDTLNLTLGFSHPVAHKMPAGIKVETPTQTEILIKGVDRQMVGQVAAEVRAYRRPEPYKGKGVRYADEVVTIKETKKK